MKLNRRRFGLRLVHLRDSLGLNQGEMARHVGIPQAALSRYEGGMLSPSMETLHRIAFTTRVSVDYLLGLSGELSRGQQQSTTDMMFSKLDDDAKQLVTRLVLKLGGNK